MIKNGFSILLILILLSCGNDNSFRTASGLEVKYIDRGNEEILLADSILIVYMKQQNSDGITLHHSYPMRPLVLRFTEENSAGHLWEVISRLTVGDSVNFETTANNLFETTYKQRVPDSIAQESKIDIQLKVAEQFSDLGYQKYKKRMDRKADSLSALRNQTLLQDKLISDGDSIDRYLIENKIQSNTAASGLRYSIQKLGTGDNIVSGDTVVIHYVGRLLSGEQFDSSYDRDRPYGFVVGIGEVIKGWDEGLTYLNKGAKATFYVPSPLAYGSRMPNPEIPPYAIMVFDVEVVDVKKK